jgi:hypothetical protein
MSEALLGLTLTLTRKKEERSGTVAFIGEQWLLMEV